MTEVEKLRALLAEARREIATWHLGPRDPLVRRIDAALAEPVEDGPVVIRFSSPLYACLDCGHCDEGLTLTWLDGEPTKAMCLKCRRKRMENIEDSVLALVRERDEARAEANKLREVLLSKHGGEPLALLRELDEARAEVERLRRALICSEDDFGHRCIRCDSEVEP